MLHAVVRYATNPDLACIDGVFDCSPALKARTPASIGGVKEEQVNIAKPTFLYGSRDGFACGVIGRIRCQLGREVYVFSSQRIGVGIARQKVEDGFAAFLLVVIHLSRVNAV